MSFSNMHLVEASMRSLLVLSVSVRVYYRITVHLSVLYPYLYQRYARTRTHPTRVPVPVLRPYPYPLDGRRRVLYCDKYRIHFMHAWCLVVAVDWAREIGLRAGQQRTHYTIWPLSSTRTIILDRHAMPLYPPSRSSVAQC